MHPSEIPTVPQAAAELSGELDDEYLEAPLTLAHFAPALPSQRLVPRCATLLARPLLQHATHAQPLPVTLSLTLTDPD
jgi:hypothetical protein